MHVRVLGPVELCGKGVPALAGSKPRELVTYLGLHAGELVAGSLLVDLLWGDAPPKTADRSLQTHVSTLRRSLGREAVVRRGDSWQLDVPSVDALDFLSEIRHGKEAQRAGDVEAAAAHYEAALAEWRGGPALPDTPRGEAERVRWQEFHDDLVEDRAEVLLAGGRAADLVADLEAAVAASPLRERRWAQLMLALYRAGRQPDALRAYQRFRDLLAEELGLEPSAELRRLERRIVLQDEALLLEVEADPAATDPAATDTPPRRFRALSFSARLMVSASEPWLILAAGVGAATAVVAGFRLVGTVALAVTGWLVAVLVRTVVRRGRPPAPAEPVDLREPWRQFVVQADTAAQRFQAAVAGVGDGPLGARLRHIGERLGEGAAEAQRMARRGQHLDDVRRNIDTFAIERELDDLGPAEGDPGESRIRTIDALRAQLASADRLDQLLTDAHDHLRQLAASLAEAVARSFELAVRSDAQSDLGDVHEDLDDVIEEMEALRQGLDDTDLTNRASA